MLKLTINYLLSLAAFSLTFLLIDLSTFFGSNPPFACHPSPVVTHRCSCTVCLPSGPAGLSHILHRCSLRHWPQHDTTETGEPLLQVTQSRCPHCEVWNTVGVSMNQLHVFLSDDCPLWCGRSVTLNTTPRRSMNPELSSSPPPSLSLTSCCSSLSEWITKWGGHQLIYYPCSFFYLLPILLYFSRDQNMTDIMPLYKTMKKATFSDSEDEVNKHSYFLLIQWIPSFCSFILTSHIFGVGCPFYSYWKKNVLTVHCTWT